MYLTAENLTDIDTVQEPLVQPVVLVITGTGYEKTLPLVVNCFLQSDVTVWIVSSLNCIEIEQARVFTDRGWLLARARDDRGATPATATQHARACGNSVGE
ncbi:hypothetical protein FRC12_003190 [Ceratobasidium sp. 428]|nr:hypothetical protein FRC12_003190 [Ceratobasidium sp. 428]